MELQCLRVGMRLRCTWGFLAIALSTGNLLLLSEGGVEVAANPDYGRALELSLYFFEAQRSGYLPADQRITWRGNSGLNDGQDQNVGDGDTDHECWQRPEDMSTSRRAYKIDERNPGSEVAGETAAAMAAASIVYKDTDANYSYILLTHAEHLFTFADQYRGRYDASIPIVQRYYPSISGYGDELLWAAFWLFEATGNRTYLDYTINNAQELGGTGWAMTQFGWDVKYSGLQVLASKILLEGRGGEHGETLRAYQTQAAYFLCACLNQNNGKNVKRSPGGLFWIQPWNNMQFVTSAAFLLTVYLDYLTAANQQLSCQNAPVHRTELLKTAKGQIDYILGNNPRGTSYMVGFTQNYPKEVHHRGASIVSIHLDASPVECREGYVEWYKKPDENPNLLIGALVGGPDANDNFADQRDNFQMTEACLYNNGPLVGVLARLSVSAMGQYRHSSLEMILQAPPRLITLHPRLTMITLQQLHRHSPPLVKQIRHQLPRKIHVAVQEWQSTTGLVEEKMLHRRWEGVWIQVLGFAGLLYRCLFRLLLAWFMYGGLKSEALFMFSKSLARRLAGVSFG